MSSLAESRWLVWARELQSLAQTGLAFNNTEYDRQRYTRLLEIAAEITAEHTRIPAAEIAEVFRLQPGYATPKIDIRGALVRDGKILLVRERVDGRWCMPGGWVDVGESPSEAVTREVREESGFLTVARKIVGVFEANRSGRPIEFFHAFKVVFLCDITGGEATPSDETTEVAFFDPAALPELSENRTGVRHIEEVMRQVKDPSRLPVFD